MLSREIRLSRSSLLLTPAQMETLRRSHILLFGLGGVGGYAAEALARSGVGRLTLIDGDTVSPTNLNRQLAALSSTIGQNKANVMAARLQDAAPDCIIDGLCAFHLPQNPVPIPEDCSMVLDAVDTLAAKLHLAQTCQERKIPLVSCMGMGNRLDPTCIRVGDIFETSGCPLCRDMRKELRKRHIDSLRCVYSTEPAHVPLADGAPAETKASGRPVPGSVSFVPSVAGLYMAYEAVRQLCGLAFPQR